MRNQLTSLEQQGQGLSLPKIPSTLSLSFHISEKETMISEAHIRENEQGLCEL